MSYILIVHLLWAIFAGERQKALYGDKNLAIVYILNFIFCPIAIIIATVKNH